jgi:hypothetical protein
VLNVILLVATGVCTVVVASLAVTAFRRGKALQATAAASRRTRADALETTRRAQRRLVEQRQATSERQDRLATETARLRTDVAVLGAYREAVDEALGPLRHWLRLIR